MNPSREASHPGRRIAASLIIAAIRADTENVASEIDEVEKSFGEVDAQMANFKTSAGKFVKNFAA